MAHLQLLKFKFFCQNRWIWTKSRKLIPGKFVPRQAFLSVVLQSFSIWRPKEVLQITPSLQGVKALSKIPQTYHLFEKNPREVSLKGYQTLVASLKKKVNTFRAL